MASSSNVKVSFIAKVELIELRQGRSWGKTPLGWTPPDTKEAFARVGQQRLFRWYDGSMKSVNEQHPGTDQAHSVATIFSQGQSNSLLAVLCDARSKDPRGTWGWRSLRFEAAKPPAAATLSHVGPKFKNEKLRVSGEQSWVGQLLPTCYHQGNPTNGHPVTGLVGEPRILIALAVLFTSVAKMEDVLPRSIRDHKWIPHTDGQEPLRNSNKIGIVVTIYYDPQNSPGSTKDRLERLERGEYGAFYQT